MNDGLDIKEDDLNRLKNKKCRGKIISEFQKQLFGTKGDEDYNKTVDYLDENYPGWRGERNPTVKPYSIKRLTKKLKSLNIISEEENQ